MRDSLVILSFNKLDMTRHCLSAVVRGTRFGEGGEGAEFVIVDNGSQDGSAEWLADDFAALCAEKGVGFRLVRNDRNVGCSTARNQAVALAAGRYVTFLDNDVEPASPDWLDALRARVDASPENGMAGALMLYPPPDGRIQCAGVGISKRGHVCFCGRGEPAADPRFQHAREVQCLISACLMVRASLLREHGAFDEAYNPVQFEDFDLCYRLRERGSKAWFEPAARMFHHESTTTAGSPSIRNAAVVVRNGLRFQKAWRHMFSQEDGPSEEECRWRRL